MNHKISVNIPNKPWTEYSIIIGKSISQFTSYLPKKIQHIVIITDNRVKKYYGLDLQKRLKKNYPSCLLLSFPPGEKFKNNTTKQLIENAMLRNRCARDTLIIALGGGVVGDLSGFIASTYLRGIPYIQIPTTLLAMVDSSIGGKTAINTAYGKNLIGTIYQPAKVIIDITLLQSLSKKNIINGLIEAIKMFLTYDATSFNYTKLHLNQLINGDTFFLKKIVSRAVSIKAAVIGRDEKDNGERSVLNFGHTFGHALEKISNYTVLHGYAVGYGILVEATISHMLDLLNKEQLQIIKQLLAQLDIYGKYLKKYDISKLICVMKHDKKMRQQKIHYTLLSKIGSAYVINGNYVHPVADEIVRHAFKNIIQE